MSRGWIGALTIFAVGVSFLGAAVYSTWQPANGPPNPTSISNQTSLAPTVPSIIPQTSASATVGSKGTALPESAHFELSSRCALCHSFSDLASAMRDSQKQSVAPVDLWQASMMAHSSRDPYWRAVVSAEIAATPNAKAHIEELCTRCHAPMAAPITLSPPGETLAFLKPANRQAKLGLDGVSCTVCHQIQDTNFGKPESFTGHFVLNTESLIYGPHVNPVTMPMQRNVEFTPTHGPHVLKSALCATCHTVVTDAANPDGSPAATQFHEQAPYLEWRNSVFNDEIDQPNPAARSCQSCHMPTSDVAGTAISTKLAHNPGGRDFPFLRDRQPYGRHTLVGGNALMTRILRDNAEALQIEVPKSSFDSALKEIDQMLRYQTGKIELGEIVRMEQSIHVPVTVQNLCGHKLPTAYPSRRVWIQFQVRDATDQIIFRSGGFNENGQLIDQQNQVLPSEFAQGPLLSHFDQIDKSQQAQVYESIMADASGNPTFLLVRGAHFFKDNRLLPQGWLASHRDANSIQPTGLGTDDNFIGGSDLVIYKLALSGTPPFRIEASLHYQVISPRHAAELFTAATPEVASFQSMYNAADTRPELIDQTNRTVD